MDGGADGLFPHPNFRCGVELVMEVFASTILEICMAGKMLECLIVDDGVGIL